MNSSEQARPVNRTVHFYRIYTAMEGTAMVPFDNAALCAAIGQLERSEDPYWDPTGEGEVQICAYLDDEAHDDRFALAKIKRHARPLTEAAMVRGPLRLSPGEGLLEPIHIRLFPNNIIGVEYNDDGPRISRLRGFLRAKFPEQYGTFELQPIYDRDAVERLGRLEEIRLLHFQVNSAALDMNVRERNFFRGLLASAAPTQMHTIEIIMRVSERGDHAETGMVKEEVEQLLNATGGVQKVKVKGREADGKSEEIDLLKDRLVSRQHVIRIDRDTRAINPASAYQAIRDAYQRVWQRIPQIEFTVQDDG